ncbi:MAG: ABC transporter ATP-binding protein [Eubacterium sp.]|nr:ABC transporter ATP-binding protein [Eubacterium sp.]
MENQNKDMDVMIQISNVKKRYRLGQIGGGSLQADLQSWWARIRGKEDPNTKIGVDQRSNGETFMALNGIDLTIYKGEAVGIIGGNGAGKSTLLKLLSRVTAPTEGEIDIYGRIASMLEVGTGFSPEMTGRENVYMNGAILGMTKAEIDAKMEDIIEFSEVREFIDTPVKRYSSGMYVKLAFSVAAHLDSDIMIMDEVLAVGDMAFQKKCLDKMRDAAKKEGRTVLYVSHNMNTIRQLCDRCIVLDKGKIVFQGDIEESIQRYMGLDNIVNLPCYYNFEKNKRLYHFGKQIRLQEVQFLDKEFAKYEIGENIKFQISVESDIELGGAQIIVQIKDNQYTKIGMALSERFDLKCEKNQHFQFEMGTDYLSHDIYCLNLEIVKVDELGNYFAYDNPGSKMIVELVNEHGHNILWNKNYWGQVSFPMVKVVK